MIMKRHSSSGSHARTSTFWHRLGALWNHGQPGRVSLGEPGWVSARRSASRRRTRLQLEPLESRCLLSAGSLDTTFGVGGQVVTDFGGFDQANAVAIQPNDDKIVVAGVTDTGGGGENFALARYNPDGTPDLGFSFDGKVATDFFGG